MLDKRTPHQLLKDIERLAKDATQGQWWIDSHGHSMVAFSDDKDMDTVFITDPHMGPAIRHESTGNLSQWRNDVDATYIATACPQNVMAVISYLQSSSNAWKEVKEYMETGLHGDAAKLRNEVSRKLFDDGCHSAATHMTQFIEALIDENMCLKEQLETK